MHPTVKQHKILQAARAAFLRYGYKRVSMGDIAAAAGISRPALYLVYKSKEQIFCAVFDDWAEETLAEIERETATLASPHEKLCLAFDLWAARHFDAVLQSPEARELLDCNFDFARQSLTKGYERLETLIAPIIEPWLAMRSPTLPARSAARVLTGALRGFKQVAGSAAELRALIADLVMLSLPDPLAQS